MLEYLNIFDSYNAVYFGFAGGLFLLDFVYQPRKYPKVKYWRIVGVLFFLMAFYLSYYTPFLWDTWLGQYRLFDFTNAPFLPSVILGLIVYELGIYGWHRLQHTVPALWRWNHQLHHSAERIDAYGGNYFNPIDLIGFALVWSFVFVLCFGLNSTAAASVGLIVNIIAVYQHSNIKTPHWLGYFVVRPEMHSAHHERGVHWRNFCDVPLWDMLFGTYYNPKTWDGKQAGFFDGSTGHFLDILRGKDISIGAEPTAEQAAFGAVLKTGRKL